jgi:hypothetical protein
MRKLFRRECLGRSKDHVAGSVDDHVKPVIRRDDLFERSRSQAPTNALIVATANKLARIVWAVLSSGEDYRAATSSVAV